MPGSSELVEQAVFTSAETDRSAGYQLVARSPGIGDADARELVAWSPSHDSLLDLSPDATSCNFHPLPSGAYCVSRTTSAGWEYSGRGGRRVHSHCLVVPPGVLERYANNPFALLKAAMAAGAMAASGRVPSRLEPIALPGRAAAVDQDLLARLALRPGAQAVAALVQAARESACLAVSGEPSPADLIAGLLSCLPPQVRREFSFSTGLKFSSRRPFRVVALSGDRSEQRWVAHHPNVAVIDLSADAPLPATPLDAWSQLIERVLAWKRVSFLATQLMKRRFDLADDDLPVLGLQLIEELEASALHQDGAPDEPPAPTSQPSPPTFPRTERTHAAHRGTAEPSGGLGRFSAAAETNALEANAAETDALEADAPTATAVAPPPSTRLRPDSPEVLERLEHLDDLVYGAIGGQTAALGRLRTLWPELRNHLGDDLLAESREQYLRYAMQIWERCVSGGELRNPASAVQALDVLCVLFDE